MMHAKTIAAPLLFISVIGGIVVTVSTAWLISGLALTPTQYQTLRSTPELGLIMPNATDRFVPADFGHFVVSKYIHNPKHDLGLDYENILIPAKEGAILRGWYVPAQKHSCKHGKANVVVLVHGAFGDRREMLRHVAILNPLGYHTVLFDTRDHGTSDFSTHRGCSLGVREHEDIISVVDYLEANKKNQIGKIAVLGSSNGAASSIMAASLDSRINAVVAENPFHHRAEQLKYSIKLVLGGESWGSEKLADQSTVGRVIDIVKSFIPDWFVDFTVALIEWRMGGWSVFHVIDAVKNIHPRGLLLMHGDADTLVPIASSLKLLEAANSTNSELWTVPNGAHARLINQQEKEYAARVTAFLGKHVGLCL
jgi:pimeloyl-ACP methyl ester carboxylesterase